MAQVLTHLLLILTFLSLQAESMVNPLTDVCWECIFPMTVGGVNITPQEKEFTEYSQATCACAGTPPQIGIPLSFWEPARLVDVTRHSYKLVGLGGVTLGTETVKNRGSVGSIGDLSNSFYHVHYYVFPVLSMLGLLTDLDCISKEEMDVMYMSEFDPLWGDDELQNIFNPEAQLFANPLAVLACIADCTDASLNRKPTDKLFWCAGCHGSLYPFTGTISHHRGPVQASSLILYRCLAKLHRMGLIKGYKENNFCEPNLMPVIKKSLYKTQLVKPVPQTNGPCHALGKWEDKWGKNVVKPGKDEDDFTYLLWVKKQCCIDAVKPVLSSF